MIRAMRLWRNGMATPIYTGTSSERAFTWLVGTTPGHWPQPRSEYRGRQWIEDDRFPAVALDSGWKPKRE